MTLSLSVRTACREDAYALWIWANDPVTRQASFRRDVIAWSDHVQWIGDRLNDEHHWILIGETADQRPVGTIRFDTDDEWTTARLSYGIAPEARGQRLARPLVSAGIDCLRARYPSVSIRADVMRENTASLRVFEGLGWEQQSVDETAVRFWMR